MKSFVDGTQIKDVPYVSIPVLLSMIEAAAQLLGFTDFGELVPILRDLALGRADLTTYIAASDPLHQKWVNNRGTAECHFNTAMRHAFAAVRYADQPEILKRHFARSRQGLYSAILVKAGTARLIAFGWDWRAPRDVDSELNQLTLQLLDEEYRGVQPSTTPREAAKADK